MKTGRYLFKERQNSSERKQWDVYSVDKYGFESRLYSLTVRRYPEYNNQWLYSVYSVRKLENMDADKVPNTIATFGSTVATGLGA